MAFLGPGLVFTGCEMEGGGGPSSFGRVSSGSVLRETAIPASIRTLADWDDVEPAIGVALGRTELVKVGIERPTPDRIEVRLLSSQDEPGLLVVAREAAGPDPVPMTLTCTVGRFGDPAREGQLIAYVVERLEQLRGVEFAPVRE